MNSNRQFALLRIAFGLVWAINASFKWQPAFLNGFVNQVTSALSGQPAWIAAWIQFWSRMVSPHAFMWALLVALTESTIAVGLILGFRTRFVLLIGIVFSLLVWSVPEGFGGPYSASSTDIGCAIIYVFVFISLWIGTSWKAYSIDSITRKRVKV